MPSPRVLVIGCGISGPVIAMFLKRKGYTPVVYERTQTPDDLGASLMIWPNGMKVLGLVGIAAQVIENGPSVVQICEKRFSGEVLAQSSLPGEFQNRYGQPANGIKRTMLTSMLRDAAVKEGIEVRAGWALESVREDESSVTAMFSDGREESGSLLIGCDGMKGVSRKAVLECHGVPDSEPNFTGITQTAAFSPTPALLREQPLIGNWYGEGMHVVCYPITSTMTSWAVTLREAYDSQGPWGLYDAAARAATKEKLLRLLKGWDPILRELAGSAERIIKYGIFDRPELSSNQWYSKRCVLVGDAAHATSVHIGQGANQSFEDCYHLSNCLPDVSPETGRLSTAQLQEAFEAYAAIQQPRTAALVKAARAQGNIRVVNGGPEACRKRDEDVKKNYADHESLVAKYDAVYEPPFGSKPTQSEALG